MNAMHPKTEAILLSGFLGSGKTTLLKQLLTLTEDLSDTVVIMNEFGEISIDGMLIDRDVKMVELVNGCICCTLQLDLKKQIEDLVNRFHPRRLIMEATGLADTSALLDVFADYTQQQMLSSFRVIAVIDGQIWPMRHILGPVFDHQLSCAELILFNKVDTLDNELIEGYVGEVTKEYPGAFIVLTAYCLVNNDLIQKMIGQTTSPGRGNNKIMPFHHQSTSGWKSLAFVEANPMDDIKFHCFLEKHREDIFRIKGPIRFRDGSRIINYTTGRSDWSPTDDNQETKLVLIGRVADIEKIRGELSQCVIS